MTAVKNNNNSVMTLQRAIDSFLFHCQYEKNLSPKTLRAYQTALDQFIGYIIKDFDIEDISAIHKEMIKRYLQHVSLFKPKTVKRKIASLKAMFNFLEYEDDHFMNPFRKMKIRFKEPTTLPTVMNMGEIRKLLQIVYSQRQKMNNEHRYKSRAIVRDIAVIELLFATGVRVSELCALQSGEVDIKKR